MKTINNEIAIQWSVDDGYAGHRPQASLVHPEDFYYQDGKEAVVEQITEYLQEEFAQKIMQCYKKSDIEEAAE